MTRLLPFALALFCCGLTTPEALAIGSDHPNGPITGPASGGNDLWPAGLVALVNRPDRVHGFWVNETDVFFHDGDTEAINQYLDGYGELKETELSVVLHAGAKKARSPWDKADRDVPVAWSIHASSCPLDGTDAQGDQTRCYTRVDVWLGSRVKLDDLRIPAGIPVTSGGEIEKFIAERQGQSSK